MEAKRRALDEMAALQCAADEKRNSEAERRPQAARSKSQRWFSNRTGGSMSTGKNT
jgi:hypothetical protein